MTSITIDGELQPNSLYSSLEAFLKCLQAYITKYGITLHRSDSHRINYKKMQPQFAEEIINKFTYSNMTYTCQFNRRKNRAKTNISSGDMPKEGCKFKIIINLTNDFKYLKITRMDKQSEHNHPVKVITSEIQPAKKVELTMGQKDHMTSIMKQLSELRKSGQFCDTVILTHGGTLFAHACVLSVACPRLGVFLNRHPLSNSLHNNIDMTKYKTEVVQALLDFIYEGHLNMLLFEKIQLLAFDLGITFNVKTQQSAAMQKKISDDLSQLKSKANITELKSLSNIKKNKSVTGQKISALKKVLNQSGYNRKIAVTSLIVRNYRCSNCGKVNHNRRELLLHQLIYCALSISRVKQYYCKVCDAACNSIHSLHAHMNLSHGVRKAKYRCARCKSVYFYRRNLVSHQTNANKCRRQPVVRDGVDGGKINRPNPHAKKASPIFIRIPRPSVTQNATATTPATAITTATISSSSKISTTATAIPIATKVPTNVTEIIPNDTKISATVAFITNTITTGTEISAATNITTVIPAAVKISAPATTIIPTISAANKISAAATGIANTIHTANISATVISTIPAATKISASATNITNIIPTANISANATVTTDIPAATKISATSTDVSTTVPTDIKISFLDPIMKDVNEDIEILINRNEPELDVSPLESVGKNRGSVEIIHMMKNNLINEILSKELIQNDNEDVGNSKDTPGQQGDEERMELEDILEKNNLVELNEKDSGNIIDTTKKSRQSVKDIPSLGRNYSLNSEDFLISDTQMVSAGEKYESSAVNENYDDDSADYKLDVNKLAKNCDSIDANNFANLVGESYGSTPIKDKFESPNFEAFTNNNSNNGINNLETEMSTNNLEISTTADDSSLIDGNLIGETLNEDNDLTDSQFLQVSDGATDQNETNNLVDDSEILAVNCDSNVQGVEAHSTDGGNARVTTDNYSLGNDDDFFVERADP